MFTKLDNGDYLFKSNDNEPAGANNIEILVSKDSNEMWSASIQIKHTSYIQKLEPNRRYQSKLKALTALNDILAQVGVHNRLVYGQIIDKCKLYFNPWVKVETDQPSSYKWIHLNRESGEIITLNDIYIPNSQGRHYIASYERKGIKYTVEYKDSYTLLDTMHSLNNILHQSLLRTTFKELEIKPEYE